MTPPLRTQYIYPKYEDDYIAYFIGNQHKYFRKTKNNTNFHKNITHVAWRLDI